MPLAPATVLPTSQIRGHRAQTTAMQVFIVGTSKLAAELLSTQRMDPACQAATSASRATSCESAIVVHAGSGRELAEVISWCQATRSTRVELATGSAVEALRPEVPVVLCPNTNVLMLRFMHMLAGCGHLFRNQAVRLSESHQADMASAPGTALAMARALGLNASDVDPIRYPEAQKQLIRIPADHLDRHAYHRVLIEDRECSIAMETRVYGQSPYADGVAQT